MYKSVVRKQGKPHRVLGLNLIYVKVLFDRVWVKYSPDSVFGQLMIVIGHVV